MADATATAAVHVYTYDRYLPGRVFLRKVFDSIRTEFLVTALVLINMLGLLIDMAVTDAGCNIYANVSTIQQCLDDHANDLVDRPRRHRQQRRGIDHAPRHLRAGSGRPRSDRPWRTRRPTTTRLMHP